MHPLSPARDCPLCPRLCAFREENRRTEPDWFQAPVPSFGSLDARLLIVGLAPGLRGANRTGRPFTGDYAGQLLYPTLCAFGFAQGTYAEHAEDGLELVDCLITNAVRCVPPHNKPTPQEIKTCRPFLEAHITSMPRLKGILVLGRIAQESVLRALRLPLRQYPFKHGETTHLPGHVLFQSYHCSRYNTNTGRLTEHMFHDVFRDIRTHIEA